MATHAKNIHTKPDQYNYFQPRLAVKNESGKSKKAKAFLQMSRESEVLEIGDVESPQYKLVQCLFSPRNFQSAKYNSVFQTIERVFGSLQADTKAAVSYFAEPDPVEKITRMKLAIQNIIKKLKETEAGKHLKFHWFGEQIQMEIVMA